VLLFVFDAMIVFFAEKDLRKKKSAVKKKGAKPSHITLKFFDTNNLFWNWIRSSQHTPGTTKNHSFKTHTQ
tara:strand:+ start:329 stop:541 length:213 start_codon:yes stop_codon:yes gene_type:complete